MTSTTHDTAVPLEVDDAVSHALASRHAVAALETAVLTHGLPRDPWSRLQERWPRLGAAPEWLDASIPVHLAAMRAMVDAVRAAGAVPAVTAVIDGRLRLGVTDAEITGLSELRTVRKLAQRDLPAAVVAGASGGTTVSAAITIARAGGVRLFATGGIGGVHRGWQQRPDVSADLTSLGRTPVCVVSSGAKSILDLPATLEALETLSVPVVGFRCDLFPRFVCAGDPSLRVPIRIDEEATIGAMARTHWSLGGGALLVVNPVAQHLALEGEALAAAEHASEHGDSAAAIGAAATPALLGRVAEATAGASLRANIELLRGNAALAARLAASLSGT